MVDKDPKKQDQRQTGAGHESTWGATEAAKASWDDKHGDAARRATERRNKEGDE